MSFRCASNCQHKVSTKRKLLVKKECTGVSCKLLTTYRWSLYVSLDNGSSQSWSKVHYLEDVALTSLDGPDLAIGGELNKAENKSALMNSKTYRITLIAWLDEENYQVDEFVFNTNSPPSKQDEFTGCVVDPKQGQAVITEFSISCFNWTDTDRPLSYQFSYQTKFGLVVFHSGWRSNLTTDLPPGNEANNYSLIVLLEVLDSLGDSSEEKVIVQV